MTPPVVRPRAATLRLVLLAALALAAPASIMPAHAYDPTSAAAVNVAADGLALRGFDPVAYQVAGAPTPGDPSLTATHEGAVYRFASAANRDAFLADPARYAPAFGGFCALGASYGKKIDADPHAWRVVDGRLYVNVTPAAQERWQKDISKNIGRAEAYWPKIRDRAPNDL